PAELAGVVEAIRRAVVVAHEVEVAGVRIVGSGVLPKTSSGKLQRGAARQTWLADGFTTLYRWESPEPSAPPPPAPTARPGARRPVDPGAGPVGRGRTGRRLAAGARDTRVGAGADLSDRRVRLPRRLPAARPPGSDPGVGVLPGPGAQRGGRSAADRGQSGRL